MDIAEVKEIIMNITRNDFLSDLADLYSAFQLDRVVPGNDSDKAFALVEKYFNSMNFEPSLLRPLQQQRQPAILIKQKHIAVISPLGQDCSKKTNQLTQPIPLSVLSSILGGGNVRPSLFHEIRDNAGCYSSAPVLMTIADLGTLVPHSRY